MKPAQSVNRIELRQLSKEQPPLAHGRILFRDAGFDPRLSGTSISLGPNKMAMIGFGKYSRPEFDMGIEDEVVIPRSIEELSAEFLERGSHEVEATVPAPRNGCLRIVMRQRMPDGYIRRTGAGGPPSGENMEGLLRSKSRRLAMRCRFASIMTS